MIILADSGSTKTDWVWLPASGDPVYTRSAGMNPVLHSPAYLLEQTTLAFDALPESREVQAIFFYGAGCWEKEQKGQVESALRTYFREGPQISVEHDLLGAARAVCGKQPGIACILGTGSNSCLYDGQNIQDAIPNLGYILGDEGSGADLGRQLIRAYFYRELPPEIERALEPHLAGGRGEIVRHVYSEPHPNRYLAGFAPFLHEHLDHPYLTQMILRSFSSFLERHVLKYPNAESLPIHFVGSIAHFFRPLLVEALAKFGLKPGLFVRRPIANLISFHQPN